MQSLIARLVMSAIKSEPKRSIRASVIARAKTGLCLLGRTGKCDVEAETRGLCGCHYQAFWRNLSKCETADDAVAYDSEMVREGLILPSQWARQIKSDDPFVQLTGK